MSKTKSNDSWIRLSLIVVPVPFIVMIWAMWYFDFFVFTGSEANAKIVGTALTLGGGLVATMVTLIGLVLRHSTEKRNADLRDEAEKRLKLEGERNKDLQEEAEKRLKLEAAIKAVGLLGTSEGKDSTETQLTGALFALAHLGSVDLAVDLVRIMLMRPKKLIGPEATASLLNIALCSDDLDVKETVCEFLGFNFETLLVEGGIEWPQSITKTWPLELSSGARHDLSIGLMSILLERPMKDWSMQVINFIVANLVLAMRSEVDQRIECNIGLYLQKLLQYYESDDLIYLDEGNMLISELRSETEKIDTQDVDIDTISLIERLEKWLKKK